MKSITFKENYNIYPHNLCIHKPCKDFDIPKNAAKEEVRDAQKLLAHDSNTQISLSAVGVGLLASVMMLGVHLRRWLQPGTIVASSSVDGSDMSINMARSHLNEGKVSEG